MTCGRRAGTRRPAGTRSVSFETPAFLPSSRRRPGSLLQQWSLVAGEAMTGSAVVKAPPACAGTMGRGSPSRQGNPVVLPPTRRATSADTRGWQRPGSWFRGGLLKPAAGEAGALESLADLRLLLHHVPHEVAAPILDHQHDRPLSAARLPAVATGRAPG